MEVDTLKSIWDYEDVNPKVYYFLGKSFAKRDITRGVYLIQTYGNPDWEDPCTTCRYEKYGFKIKYHWDVIWDKKTNFIKGYNEVSKAYLKTKIGASAFSRIDVFPKLYFNPKKIIRKFFDAKNRQKFYDVELINDSIAKVKIKIDSVFRYYPNKIKKIYYHIRDLKSVSIKKDTFQILSYHQMKDEGFLLSKDSLGKFSYNIKFDFSRLIPDHLFCSCAFKNENSFSYIDKLVITK